MDGEASDIPDITAFHDFEPVLDDFQTAVVAGLSGGSKSLPCKFLYDEEGSRLFDRICELEEYYPTRTETRILRDYANEISELAGSARHLIEFGSGSSIKVRILLNALARPAAYTALDISRDHLLRSAASLAGEYAGLDVIAVCADYTRRFEMPRLAGRPDATRVGFFPGSTIGNFTPEEAVDFLANALDLLDGGDLLIGVDLKKDAGILNAAYNDSLGVTDAFNLNLLTRINRELGGGFDVTAFTHHAFYNPDQGRVELYIVSGKQQSVRVAHQEFNFTEGERIHTEYSYKYSVEEFQDLAARAGFRPAQAWVDDNNLFSVHYLRGPDQN